MAASILRKYKNLGVDLNHVPVEVVGRAIDRVKERNGGHLPKGALVEEARPQSSPIHDIFTHDKEEALKKWNLYEESTIVRRVVVVNPEMPEDAELYPRVHVTIRDDDAGTKIDAYVDPEQALERSDWRRAVLKEIIGRLRGDVQNHKYITELAPIIQAIDQVAEDYNL